MGMDVYGKKPTNLKGEYFCASVWSWRPIATYLEHRHADLASKIEYLHSNDGDGLDADDARTLGNQILADIVVGGTQAFLDQWNAELKEAKPSDCPFCGATGIRTDDVGVKMGMPTKQWTDEDGTERTGWCNGCGGSGQQQPIEHVYLMEPEFNGKGNKVWDPIEMFTEFAEFLRASGGFEIW